jgi:hypothetical protein
VTNLYLLFVVVRSRDAEFGPVWFVPSHVFHAKAMRDGREKLRMSASTKPDSRDQWREYRLDNKAELAPAILAALDRL